MCSTDFTLYWLTNTAVSAARFYWELHLNLYNAANVPIPAAVSVFPGENYQAPTKLDGAGVSQTDLLQPSRQRWTLCGLGTAEALFRRGSRGLQIAAVDFFTREERRRCAMTDHSNTQDEEPL